MEKGAFHLDLVPHSPQLELGIVRAPLWGQCLHFLLCALDALPATTAIVASSEHSSGEKWPGKEDNWSCPSHQGLSSVDVAGVLKILKILYPIRASILLCWQGWTAIAAMESAESSCFSHCLSGSPELVRGMNLKTSAMKLAADKDFQQSIMLQKLTNKHQ